MTPSTTIAPRQAKYPLFTVKPFVKEVCEVGSDKWSCQGDCISSRPIKTIQIRGDCGDILGMRYPAAFTFHSVPRTRIKRTRIKRTVISRLSLVLTKLPRIILPECQPTCNKASTPLSPTRAPHPPSNAHLRNTIIRLHRRLTDIRTSMTLS